MKTCLHRGLLLLAVFAVAEALAETETKTLAIKDSVLEAVRPSQQPIYAGYTVTLQVTGQIDANHEQWEEDKCQWFDVFHWGCKKVRRHLSHYQPHSEVGVVFQLADAQGGTFISGTPRSDTQNALSHTTYPERGLVPGSSGNGWQYNANTNLSTLTLTLEPDSGKANALLEPAFIRGIVGDRLASNGTVVTRENCSQFRPKCSEGSLAVTVTGITSQRRLQLVADYLKQRRDPGKVASDRLIDPVLAKQHPDEVATLLLDYTERFGTSNVERGKLLKFAVDNIKDGSAATASKLSRTLVNQQISMGELGSALKIIQDKISEQSKNFNDLEANSSKIPVEEAVEYAGWLTAGARVHMKLNEGVLESDVDRSIGLLRTARDVLTQVIRNRDSNAVLEARKDVASISVTLARLLSATLVPADMEEATRILTVARYYYPQEHSGSLLAGSPIMPAFVVAKSGTAGNTPRPLAIPSPPGRWVAEPGNVQDTTWFMLNEDTRRHAFVTLEGGRVQARYLPEVPAGIRQVLAQKWAVWVSPNGDIWRADPGQAHAVQRFKAADDSPRSTVFDAAGQVAMVVDPTGEFVLIALQDAGSEHHGKLAEGQPEQGQLFAVGTDQFLLAWRQGSQLKSSLIDLRLPDQPIITAGSQLPLPDELAAPAALDIQIHPDSSTREQLVALIRSQNRAWRAYLSSTPTLKPVEELGFPPQRVWRIKEGWLFARSDQASSRLQRVSSKPDDAAIVAVDFPDPVSLDRGALIAPAGAASQWMLMSDVNPTPVLSLANLARLDATEPDIKLDVAQVNGLQRTGFGNVHVINESALVVEYPLERTLRLFDTNNSEISTTVKPPLGQQVILGAISGSKEMLLLDQQSDGTVTLVRELRYDSPFIGKDTWKVTAQDCVVDGCTADIRSSDGGTVIPSMWQRMPGASPERDEFVELISTPVDGWAGLPAAIAGWDIKVRAHTLDETIRSFTVRVHKPDDYLGSVRNAKHQLFALVRDGEQLKAVAWKDGSTFTLHEGLAEGSARLFPGRKDLGVISIRSASLPTTLTLIPYGFNANGMPTSRGCSNCAALQAQFAEANDLMVNADLNLFMARQGQCLQVTQLQTPGQQVSEPLSGTLSLIDGATVYATGLPMEDSQQLRVLVPVSGQTTIINHLESGESIHSCIPADTPPGAVLQAMQSLAR